MLINKTFICLCFIIQIVYCCKYTSCNYQKMINNIKYMIKNNINLEKCIKQINFISKDLYNIDSNLNFECNNKNIKYKYFRIKFNNVNKLELCLKKLLNN